jgi:hypothetical protein
MKDEIGSVVKGGDASIVLHPPSFLLSSSSQEEN